VTVAKKELEEKQKAQSHRPLEKKWEQGLASKGIAFQQFCTMSLTGEHVHRLCIHAEDICDESQALICDSDNFTEEDLLPTLQFFDQMKELLSSFDYLCSVMTRQEIQPENEIELFGIVAKHFGKIYREYFEKGATPKVHILEIHLPMMLRRHKRLGIFGEDPIEREHHIWKRFNVMLQNVKNLERKTRAVLTIRNDISSWQVQTSIADTRGNRARYKKFSDVPGYAPSAKRLAAKLAKTNKYSGVRENVAPGVYNATPISSTVQGAACKKFN
jgi:hypothetical protein